MNKLKITYWKIFLMSFVFLIGCEKTSFMESSGTPDNITVTDLSYPSIINARAYSGITTAVPTMQSDGIPCRFSIASIRSEADGVLPEEYLEKVQILSAFMDTIRVAVEITELDSIQKVDQDGELVFNEDGSPWMLAQFDTTFHDTPIMNPNRAGQILLEDNNMFGEGDYYFSLAVTPVTNGDDNTQLFEDAFHLNVMPLLPISFSYEPVQQNLVVGEEMKTVSPTLTFAKEVPSYDLRFELLTDTDKIQINSETGEISLVPGYTIERNEAIAPSIRVISNITEEVIEFEGSPDKLQIVISDEELILNAGPLLPPAIIYLPYAQNLVLGTTEGTTEVDVPIGNPSLIYELETESDKLTIDSRTGVIRLNPNFTMVEDMLEVYPTVKTTSLISYDEKLFENKIKIVISKTAMDLPGSTFHFFFPSLVNTDGYSKNAVIKGGLGNDLYWKNKKNLVPGANANAERPAGVTKPHGVVLQNILYSPDRSTEHDSYMVMDAQDLTQYNSDGIDLKAIFWMKNDLVLYKPDGSKAATLEVYITDNYTGDIATSNFVQVDDVLTYTIDGVGQEYTGLPYPGDNIGDHPDYTPESALAYAQWLRCELDVNAFKTQKNFTLAFRYVTNFDDVDDMDLYNSQEVKWGACSGRFVISNVNYKAEEL